MVPPEFPISPTRPTLRYPDFLGIGVQKCGTSWLDRNLRAHPELWLPAIKELHYFNELYLKEKGREDHWAGRLRRTFVVDTLRWQFEKVAAEHWNFRKLGQLAHIASESVDDDWYGGIFAAADPHQICGEITPDYAHLPERAIEHIVRLSPRIKILVSLRDPIERNWSEIRMMASERGRRTEEELNALARQFEVYQRTDYVGMLKRWLRHVPAEHLAVVFMDDIASDPDTVLARLCTLLDIRPDPGVFGNKHQPANVGETMDMPDSVRAFLKHQLRSRYDELGELYPERASIWAARHGL